MPGGKVELGESLREAVIRETREETSITVDPIEVLDASDAIYRDSGGRIQFHYIFVDFLCRVRGGDLRAASDAADVKWFSESELQSVPITPTALQVLRKTFENCRTGTSGPTPPRCSESDDTRPRPDCYKAERPVKSKI